MTDTTTTMPPGPSRAELRSRVKEMREAYFLVHNEMIERYGDVVHWRVGLQDHFLINHPDDIQDVLVVNHRKFEQGHGHKDLRQIFGQGLTTAEGEVHRRDRKLMNPFFRHEHIATSFADTMTRYAVEAMERWHDGDVIEVHHEMMELTLRIVAKSLFDTDFQSAELSEFGSALARAWRVWQTPIDAPLQGLDTRDGRDFTDAIGTMHRMIHGIIDEHRQAGAGRGDILSWLMEVRDEDGNPMSDEWLRDQTMTLLASGHETTANGLTWTLYLIFENPDALAKMRAELDQVLGGRPATAGDIPRLTYTQQVLKEGWRMYPPIWGTERRALVDHELGGYRIPAGSLVRFSQFAVSRDPRWYPEPLKFDPDRFTPAGEASRPRWSYFPFGGGPRVCIGEHFARIESMIVLSSIVQDFDLELVPGHPIDFFASISTRPKYGIRMTANRRARTRV
jgi:cytochrome P450